MHREGVQVWVAIDGPEEVGEDAGDGEGYENLCRCVVQGVLVRQGY